MKKLIHNITLAISAIRNLKNWPTYFLDLMGFIHNPKLIYTLRNNIKYKVRGGTADRGIITSVCFEDEYLIKKEGVKDNSIILDIGAQAGIFSVLVTSFAKNIKVYSVEPVPENFKMLAENVELNNLKKNIKLYNFAIGKDDDQETRIFLSEDNTGAHSMALDGKKNFTVSKTITLKRIFEENKIKRCNLLKMDCEGGEYPSLYNTSQEIFDKISKIYLEYHDLNMDPRYNGISLKLFLEKKGFKVRHHDQFLYAKKVLD